MSKYALPGTFFLPIPDKPLVVANVDHPLSVEQQPTNATCICTHRPYRSDYQEEKVESTQAGQIKLNSTNDDNALSINFGKIKHIQTRQRCNTSFFGRYVRENSSPFIKQKTIVPTPSDGGDMLQSNSRRSIEECYSVNEQDRFDITVKEVIIDWVTYVNALSISKSLNDTNNRTRANRKQIRYTNPKSFSSHDARGGYPSRRRRHRQCVLPSLEDNGVYDNDENFDSHGADKKPMSPVSHLEKAIQLQFSVVQYGQSFNVVRSLDQIRHLHQELIGISNSYDATEDSRSSAPDIAEFENLDSEGVESNDGYKARRMLRQQRRTKRHFYQLQQNVSKPSIPDVPELFHGTTSVPNLQSLYMQMIQSYAPSIETWFRNVFDAIPSQLKSTLTYFFCDPILKHELPFVRQVEKGTHHGASHPNRVPQLEIIMEEEKSEHDLDF